MSNNLETILSAQRTNQNIDLSNQGISDNEASQITRFLQYDARKSIIKLDLSKNDLSSKGIEQIFNALRVQQSLRAVILDNNSLSKGSQVNLAFQSINQFIQQSRSINYLSFRSNGLTYSDIEEFIYNLKVDNKIIGVDLSWNNLIESDGRRILQIIDNNNSLQYLKLSNNKISSQDIQQLEQKLESNKRGANHQYIEQSLRNPQQDRDNQSPIKNYQGNYQNTNGYQDQGHLIQQLQQTLEQEKVHTFQVKQRMELELEDLKRKERSDLRTIQDLDVAINELQNQNRGIKFDVDRLKDEFRLIEKTTSEAEKTHQDRLKQNEYLIKEIENKHKNNAQRVVSENNNRLNEMRNEWENRLKVLDNKHHLLEQENYDLDQELRRVSTKTVDLKIRQDEDFKQLAQKIEDDEYNKYSNNLAVIQAKIQQVEEGRDLINAKNIELINEYKIKQQTSEQEFVALEDELSKLKQQHDNFLKKNTDFKVTAEKLKNDLALKDTIIEKLEREINGFNEQIELKRKFGREQMDKILFEQREDKKQWENEREIQLKTIHTLEQKIRQAHQENTRLKQEYQRLSELVSSNVNKSIYNTFIENNYF